MKKHLAVLLFAMAAIVVPSSVRAQSIHVWAHTTMDSNPPVDPHRVLIDCGTTLDSQAQSPYLAVQTPCSIYQDGQDIYDGELNAGWPSSAGFSWTESKPGSQYLGHAYNNLELYQNPNLCAQWGVSGVYTDYWHFVIPEERPDLVPVFIDQGDIFPHGNSTCWTKNQWTLVGIVWGQPKTAMQVSPRTANVSVSQTQPFTSNMSANWGVSPPVGFISPNTGMGVTYTPPSSIPNQQTITLTAYDPTNAANNDSATITLVPLKVSISPCCAFTMLPGATKPFTASVSPGVKQDVNWTVTTTGSTPGKFLNGVYTAPDNGSVLGQQTDTITACSTLDPGAPCSTPPVTITVTHVDMNVSGPSPILASAGPQTYTATVNGTADSNLTWTVEPVNVPKGADPGQIASNAPSGQPYTATYTPAAANTTEITVNMKACMTNSGPTPTVCAKIAVTVSPQVTISKVSCTPLSTCNAAETDPYTINGGGFGPTQPDVSFTPPGCVTLLNQNPPPSDTVITGSASFPIQYQSTSCQVTVTSTGNAVNSNASTIFTITPVTVTTTVTPPSANVVEGGSQQFSASATCKTAGNLNCTNIIPQSFVWSTTCPQALPNCGIISQAGLYTSTTSIPASVTGPQSISGKVSFAPYTNSSAAFPISLTPLSVSATPLTVQLAQGQTQQFSATVFPSGVNQGVTWSISPQIGTINPSTGLYTAPPLGTITSDTTITVKACSVIDSNRCSTPPATPVITLKAPDFSVTTSTNSLGPIPAGNTVTVDVSVSPAFGFLGPVTLTTVTSVGDTCPPNATCTFSPNPVTVTGAGSVFSQLTIQTAPTTPGGSDAIVVTGSGGGRKHPATNAPLNLTVSSFTLTSPPPAPASQTIMASTCANYTVTVTDINNYAGTVNLSVSGLPPASTGTFTPPSGIVPPSFSSRLQVCTTAATPAGSYPLITITAMSGVITQYATVTLNVTNFAVTATPASQSGTVSAPVIFTVTVTPQNGFNAVVNLSQTGCPTNATCTFNPPSLTGGGTSSLIVTLADTTPLNGYPINIIATSSSLIQQPPSVTLNVGPGIGLTTANSGIAGRGTTVPISWVYTPNVGTSVSINLLRENSLVQTIVSGIVIDNSTYGTQTYNWTVPLNIPIGSGYAIQVVDSSGYKDQSSGFLIIR
jgi:hypothetical protein